MIALVDCNNFFASCERLFRPDLASKPVAVLSSNDGCVVARSNEVKELDIPMGVPHFKVKDVFKRNNVQLFSSNFALYSNISQRVISELECYSPQLEVYSIDEAFMDLAELPIQDYRVWGSELKGAVQSNVGMPVSVGVAPTKTLAKLASDWAKKHDGVCLLDPKQSDYEQILKGSDVIDIWGVGRQHARKLKSAGVHSAWQLIQTDGQWLASIMGINGSRLYGELRGMMEYPLERVKKPQQSMVASRSFGDAVTSLHELETAVASFTARAAVRLRKFDQLTEVFGVFVRYRGGDNHAQYQTLSVHMMPPTNDTSELTEAAMRLTKALFTEGLRYKKAGVFAYQLSPASHEQISLLDDKSTASRERQKQLMKTVDSINTRFGGSTMQLASIDHTAQHWHGKHESQSPAYTTSWSQLPVVSS